MKTNCSVLSTFANKKLQLFLFAPSLNEISQTSCTLNKNYFQLICYLHCEINDENVIIPGWFFNSC